MKKQLLTLGFVVTFFVLCAVSAGAVENGVVKVGLRYGSNVMDAANLENAQGSGYEFGYYDGSRSFIPLDSTDETAITMIPSGGAILVTATNTGEVLYECWDNALAVQPQGYDAITWFKGYRYRGGFEYTRSGGGLQVVNVVDLEDYVKGVIPHEMNGNWPLEALKAQAVCARTYASRSTKHAGLYGFDVCNTTDCQVYNGVTTSTALSDQAVDDTAGECLWYGGELAQAVYHACNGGATESAANVWGGEVPYLLGKADPYEAMTTIPGYTYTVTYTWDQLTWVLQNSGYTIGDVVDVYISGYTDQGNVSRVTFKDRSGYQLTVQGDDCRMAFYSTTYGKIVRSMRFSITGGSGSGSGYSVNGSSTLSTLEGASVLSGRGVTSRLGEGSYTAVTASGTTTLGEAGSSSTPDRDGFTVTGTGNGHNVGMSQYGAKAMAEQGYGYEDILYFYYTGVTLR